LRAGRTLITILLVAVLAFFGVSMFLGHQRVGRVEQSAAQNTMQTARLDLPEPSVPDRDSPRLIIMNGCGRKGLAASVTRWMRRQGFDVVETGNAPGEPREETVVLLRSGRREAAERIVGVLQKYAGAGRLEDDQVRSSGADAVLILGKDFPDSLPVFW
jgi:hypothetical protein